MRETRLEICEREELKLERSDLKLERPDLNSERVLNMRVKAFDIGEYAEYLNVSELRSEKSSKSATETTGQSKTLGSTKCQ